MTDMHDSGVWHLLGEIQTGMEYLKDAGDKRSVQIEQIKNCQNKMDLRLSALEQSESTRRWWGKTTMTAAIGSVIAAMFAWIQK